MAGESFRPLKMAMIGTGYVGLTIGMPLAYLRDYVVGRVVARLIGNQPTCASFLPGIHGYEGHPWPSRKLGPKVWEGIN